jgi:hypothetical protein
MSNQHSNSHAGTPQPQMVGVPMMHFVTQPQWHQSLQPPALPGANGVQTISTPSRPGSSAGHRGQTPASSPGDKTTRADSPSSQTTQTQGQYTGPLQSQAHASPQQFPQYPNGMVPIPMMLPPGSGPPGSQVFAVPQFGFPGNVPGGLVAYYAQAYVSRVALRGPQSAQQPPSGRTPFRLPTRIATSSSAT